MFLKFVRACRKYRFTFALSTYGGLSLILRPKDTFENIVLRDDRYCNYSKIFNDGISKMKEYRRG